jgi:hypothetical protein
MRLAENAYGRECLWGTSERLSVEGPVYVGTELVPLRPQTLRKTMFLVYSQSRYCAFEYRYLVASSSEMTFVTESQA